MTKVSLKEVLTKILQWIKNPLKAHGTANTDCFYLAKRTDTETQVGFGVGSGGINHGVYSHKLGKWLIYGNASYVYVDDIRMGAFSGTATKSGNYYSSGSITYYYKNGTVTVHLSGIVMGTITTRVTIATIPEGVRPNGEEYGKVDNYAQAFYVNGSGQVQIPAGLSGKTLYGTLTYVAWK